MAVRKTLIWGAVALGIMSAPAAAGPSCSLGIGAAVMIGSLDFGAPVDISSSGQVLDGELGCRQKMGPIVVGVHARYGELFGDLDTLGVKNKIDIGASFGVMANPSTEFYGHAGWSRIDTSFVNDINGLRLGPGVRWRLGNSPVHMSAEYGYTIWDVSDITSLDVRSHDFRLGLSWNFYEVRDGKGTVRFTDETDPPAPRKTDPKLK